MSLLLKVQAQLQEEKINELIKPTQILLEELMGLQEQLDNCKKKPGTELINLMIVCVEKLRDAGYREDLRALIRALYNFEEVADQWPQKPSTQEAHVRLVLLIPIVVRRITNVMYMNARYAVKGSYY